MNNRVFYQRFFPLFWIIVGCTMPFGIVGGIIDFGFILWKILILFLFVVVLAIAGTYLLIKMPITVSTEGLNCIDWSWSYRFTSWNNIRFVKPSRAFFGLPFLRIGLNDSNYVIWLPLFLNELPEFINLVIKYAGKDNLLSKELLK